MARIVIALARISTYKDFPKQEVSTPMSEQLKPGALLPLVSDIVAAYLSQNAAAVADLPQLIGEVYRSLAIVAGVQPAAAERPIPVVPIKKSVFPDYIVCLEDGRKLKMLKRHLRLAFGLTPEKYRERWGLGPDYPMVAPNYAKQRSRLAKEIGLGTRPRKRRG